VQLFTDPLQEKQVESQVPQELSDNKVDPVGQVRHYVESKGALQVKQVE